MAWLFERTIEVAAWMAMVAAWVAAGLTVYGLVIVFPAPGMRMTPSTWPLLVEPGEAAGACVAFAVALGALACVDRFIYDADEHK